MVNSEIINACAITCFAYNNLYNRSEASNHMTQIISVHSFRGGTGKSNTTANLAALIMRQGKRVGIIDTDIQSPGI
ncbi:MAG: P-loop NTPase, partial [Anaerolineales bacterium]|nr:P-loop NTPase [Anaerolineales bacterium]